MKKFILLNLVIVFILTACLGVEREIESKAIEIKEEISYEVAGEYKNLKVLAVNVELPSKYLVTFENENNEEIVLKGFSDVVFKLFNVGDVADVTYTETNHIKEVRITERFLEEASE